MSTWNRPVRFTGTPEEANRNRRTHQWIVPEPGETPEECLIRELNEELGITTKSACLAPLTFASHAYEGFHLFMPLYVCRRFEGMPRGVEGQEIKWVKPRNLRDYPMPAADEPLIPALIDLL